MKKMCSWLMVAVFAVSAARAAAPAFSYQGVLRAADGSALARNQVIEFRLYGEATGGSARWGRIIAVQLDDEGVFNVELADSSGSPTPDSRGSLEDAILWGQQRGGFCVGLKVQGTNSEEITPRQRLLSVPFAMTADDVTQARNDFTVRGNTLLNDTQVLGGLQVNGGNVQLSKGLLVAGQATFSSAAVFNNNVSVAGGLTANGLTVLKDATITGTAQLTGRSTATDLTAQKLTVSAPVVFNGNFFKRTALGNWSGDYPSGTYTATQDCMVILNYYLKGHKNEVYFETVVSGQTYSRYTHDSSTTWVARDGEATVYMKKGETLSLRSEKKGDSRFCIVRAWLITFGQ